MGHEHHEERKDRHVHFKQEIQINEFSANASEDPYGNVQAKRTWNDSKKRQVPLDRGQFQEREVKILMNALCQYVVENELGEDGLISLCSKSKEEMGDDLKGAWCKISESLPNRSV